MRGGADYRIPRDHKTGAPQHTLSSVYRAMLLEVCSSYSCLPDVRSMTASEIRTFYDALRESLKKRTKKRDEKK